MAIFANFEDMRKFHLFKITMVCYNLFMVYLDYHLKKYPLMTTQDVVKLHLQGILGPAHLVGCVDDIIARLENEYAHIQDKDNLKDMIEMISDEYCRVYLAPYYKKWKDFTPLANAFKSSCVLQPLDEYWEVIRSLRKDWDSDFIDEYIKRGNPLISHSNEYREAYQPHYLVIKTKYIDDLK